MKKRDIVVIGASAGGIEASHRILQMLPENLAASVFVVIHLSPHAPSHLARIFGRGSKLPVITPTNEQKIESGHIYVAPANRHMLIKPGILRLGTGPRENRCRPSVDALFRTAAFAYTNRVIGIILSGALNDGTAGLMTIKAHGGLAIVQDPEDASFTGMPKSAIEFVTVDYILPAAEIAKKIIELTSNELDEIPMSISNDRPGMESIKMSTPTDISKYEIGTRGLRDGMPGENAPMTCTECGGALWQTSEHGFHEFRCHVGHSYTPETLVQEQADAIDAQFWKTLRQLEESVWLRRKLAAWARDMDKTEEAQTQEDLARRAEQQADHIREALLTDVAKLNELPRNESAAKS